MSSSATIARNVFSNATGFMVNVVVGLALTPYVSKTLGVGAYGFWMMLVASTGYYGLLDVGIRSAVGQFVTRYWAQGNLAAVSRTLSTAAGLMCGAGALALVASVVVAYASPRVFNLVGVDGRTAWLLFIVVGAGVGLNFPLMVAQSATYARQRFDIANAIAILERLVFAGLSYWVLSAGYGLLGIAFVSVGTQTAANLARTVVAYQLLPGVHLSLAAFDASSVRELFGYSVFSVLINAGDALLLNAAALAVPILMSDSAFAHYAMGASLIYYMMGLVSAIAWTFTPHATARDAQGDMQSVRALWCSGSRMVLTLAAVIAGGILFLGHDFLALWVEPVYTDGDNYVDSAVIASILVIGGLVRAGMSTGRQICFGMREVKFLALMSFIEAVIALGLSFAFGALWGLIGVAVASTAATLVIQLGTMPRFLSKRLGIPLAEFMTTVPWGAVSVLLAMGAVDLVIDGSLKVTSWPLLCAKGVILAAPALLIGIAVATTRSEKDRVLRRVFNRRRRSA